MDRVLGDMARGTRFDLYYNRIMVMMFDALSGVRHELPGGVVTSDTAKLATLCGCRDRGNHSAVFAADRFLPRIGERAASGARTA